MSDLQRGFIPVHTFLDFTFWSCEKCGATVVTAGHYYIRTMALDMHRRWHEEHDHE